MSTMSYEKVKKYFEKVGLAERVVVSDEISDTAQHAAMVIGCEMGQIAKTLSFMQSVFTGLKTVVTAIGAGVGIWGVINLLEGYGNDNPGANAHVQ